MRPQDIQGVMPLTPVVKKLIIINVAIWVVFVLILQNFVLKSGEIFEWFGFMPVRFFHDFWLWQPFTYMFIHSENVFHILFNMLLLWWMGAELEIYWGRRYFLFYYITCGVGAAVVYLICVLTYYAVTQNLAPLTFPVVGASGAIFGLILAYGMLFGERVVYFLMIFPMKAKHFVMIIGGIEFMNLVSQGFSSQVSNLAHLGGILTGYILFKIGPRLRDFMVRRQTKAHGRRLKLVVDNKDQKTGTPRYWN
jgi:membrane associated rhomboid family serine protease